MKNSIRLKFNIIIGLLAVIFVVSTSFVGYYYYDSLKTKSTISELQKELKREDVLVVDETTQQEVVSEELTNQQKIESYQSLYQKNHDLVGWISIEGTNVDFPVMQTKSVPNYYLYKNFNRQYSVSGLPYVQEDCDVFEPTDNVIIHGHHRSDGTMFAALLNYKKVSYYNQHKYIQFDTIKECHTYEIIAVFTVKVNTGHDEFAYYAFINAENETEFNNYIKEAVSRSYVNTGVTASYGDKLLTISTCDFTLTDGRFVVVAKRIK